MRAFSTEFDVSADARRVWDVMIDIERWHEWTESITSIRRLDQGPLTVGSRAVIRQPRFPAALWRVTACDEGRSFTWVSAVPGIEVVARHSVEPMTKGCHVTLSLHYKGLFGGVMGRLTRSITNEYLAFEAAGLKRRSENPLYTKSRARS